MWDLDKIQPEGSSNTGPACVRSMKIFNSKYLEAQVREPSLHTGAAWLAAMPLRDYE